MLSDEFQNYLFVYKFGSSNLFISRIVKKKLMEDFNFEANSEL